jgi:hypothetical protein
MGEQEVGPVESEIMDHIAEWEAEYELWAMVEAYYEGKS